MNYNINQVITIKYGGSEITAEIVDIQKTDDISTYVCFSDYGPHEITDEDIVHTKSPVQ